MCDTPLERGDIAIRSLGVITDVIDVTVRATDRARGAGEGARAGEAGKHIKYNRWSLADVRVIAFSLERNGMWGAEAANFVQKVAGANAPTEAEKTAAVWRFVVRVSVALQRGNGRYVELMTDRLARKLGLARSPAAAV